MAARVRGDRRAAVATGFALAIPDGYEVQVRPRSGLALKHGLTCLNTPGTIDADYRGEIKVLLINHDHVRPVSIQRGDRIAQLVVQEYLHADFTEAGSLPESDRGDTGHGSTGGFGTNPPATFEEVTTP